MGSDGNDDRLVAAAAPSSSSHLPRWGLGDVLIGLGVWLVAGALAGLFTAEYDETGTLRQTFLMLVASISAGWIGLFGVPLLVARFKDGRGLAGAFGLKPCPPRLAIKGLLIGVFTQLVVLRLVYLPIEILSPETFGRLGDDAMRTIDAAAHPLQLALLFVMVALVTPVVEEIFFRGLVLRSAERRFGPGRAAVFSAVLFAVVHLTPLLLPGIFAFGYILARMAQRYGTIVPGVFAHLAFNSLTVLVYGLS